MVEYSSFSVIIPVFKAKEFVRKAVESVVFLDEVGEVLLIEDGSNDGTYEVCRTLESDFDKLKLLIHPDHANLGEASSRNLGVLAAKCQFVAFLDADDYYLSNRFKKDIEIFCQNESIDFLYSKTAIQFFDSEKVTHFGGELASRDGNSNPLKLVLERGLFLFDVNGVSFRRKSLLKYKLFDPRLRLHTDTELWWRLIRKMNFSHAEVESPVAIAVRHKDNSINSKSFLSEFKLLVVYIDNIGYDNLYDFEIRFFVYKTSRILSNPIRSSFVRKAVLHGVQWLLFPIRFFFVKRLYYFGSNYFRI